MFGPKPLFQNAGVGVSLCKGLGFGLGLRQRSIIQIPVVIHFIQVKSGSIPQSRVSVVIATQRRQPRTPFWNSGLVQIRHPLTAAPVSNLKNNNKFSA